MKITITIETGNAAFDDAPMGETARILREMADRLEHEGPPNKFYSCRDYNGNIVGRVTVEED